MHVAGNLTPKAEESHRRSREPLAAGGRELRLAARPPARIISLRSLKKAPKSPTRVPVAPFFFVFVHSLFGSMFHNVFKRTHNIHDLHSLREIMGRDSMTGFA